jgi:hypothetical protein
MRSPWIFAAALLILGLGGWATSYYVGSHRATALVRAEEAELEWLRHEFAVNDPQFAEIKKLHEQYEPVCAQLCQRVVESQIRLETLIAHHQEVTPEITAALRQSAEVKQACQQAMLGHAYRVSRHMDPGQGRRYVAIMTQRILRPGTGIHHTQVEH